MEAVSFDFFVAAFGWVIRYLTSASGRIGFFPSQKSIEKYQKRKIKKGKKGRKKEKKKKEKKNLNANFANPKIVRIPLQ